ncbi:AAA family ATPase [Plasticicumulans sp.]|uniref:AAA family ATPase n=1 Tax=Plasticicumulans sp. TaxID=2307179 RepID=UPI00321F9319
MSKGVELFIKSMHVQHYKSIADINIDFSPVTILVGPNGSGKSNVVDCLRFLKDSFVHGIDYAMHERSGVNTVRQYSVSKPYRISICVGFGSKVDVLDRASFYSCKIDSKGGDYQIFSEDAMWKENYFDENNEEQEMELHLKRNKSGAVYINNEEQPRKFQTSVLSVSTFGFPIVYGGRTIKFASIYPNVLREPTRQDYDRNLKENCSNWGAYLKWMRQTKTGESAYKRIMELMTRVLPGLEQVRVRNVGGYFVPQFQVRDKSNQKSHTFDPVQLSDGTLRVFGLLLSLYQKPAPKFLALEEPEQTIHPGLLGVLADAVKEVSQDTQLLITTHSPYLLDYFDPEQIRVVEMNDGETTVSKICGGQLEAVKNRLMKLSEIMALDGLQSDC